MRLADPEGACRGTFLFLAGLAFLFLARVKHALQGYSTPKPFAVSEAEACARYDIDVVRGWLSHLDSYLSSKGTDYLAGKNVLELGPGSDLGTGVYLLCLGVGTYSAFDANDLAVRAPVAVYEALLGRLESLVSHEAVVSVRRELAEFQSGRPAGLNYAVRSDFSLRRAFSASSIDVIFSQAAFEHFEDVATVVSELTSVSRPGAILVAEIDFKTHSRWIRDVDPNNIYRYSSSVYGLFWFRGIPSRLRPRDYIRSLESNGWTDVRLTPLSRTPVTSTKGLHRIYRGSDAQMDILSAVVCARKRCDDAGDRL